MSKGAETRERIVDRAFRLAARDGLDGLSLGVLAGELGLSKSGLFAHFGSKEDLQVAVLSTAAARFEEHVFAPAIKAPRGLPRLRKLFDLWLRWLTDPALPGGCPMVAAAVELDDRPGRPRDLLVTILRRLHESLARAATLAIQEGHLRRDMDAAQLAFELHGIVLAFQQQRRLFREPGAEARARAAFDRLVADARG